MLLRRITEHVKAQNWTAVALDFVIVVVGVFIGIQVANWNDALTDRSREAGFYGHIIEDLQSDIAEYDVTLNATEWRMSAINQITREVTGKEIPHVLVSPVFSNSSVEPTPQFDFGTATPTAIGFLATFEGSRSAYDALINTGDVRNIRNKELLREIQDYYSRMDETNEIEKRLTVWRDQVNAQRSMVGVASTDQMSVGELARIVGANPPFFSSLRSFWQFSEIQRRVLIAEKAVAEQLIIAIESELE